MTNQIVQVRYENGALIEDIWPVLYEIAGQAIAAFRTQGPMAMFEHGDSPDADYFVRELDGNFIATGKQYDLQVTS